VTLEEFKQSIENNKNTMEKKIIGYKAPYDLFEGKVAAGTVLYPTTENAGVKLGAFYATYGDHSTTKYSRHIPKEIVERWEPMYEDDFKEGDYVRIKNTSNVRYFNESVIGKVIKLTDSKGEGYSSIENLNRGLPYTTKDNWYGINYLASDFEKLSPEEVEEMKKVEIGGYKLVTRSNGSVFSFGCQSFTRDEVLFLKRLVTDISIGAEVEIQGTLITFDILDKILNIP